MKPLVSIILPTYNSRKFINRTINCILKQKILSWELIIIDDFSTDKTFEYLKQYQKNKKIKIFKNVRNLGPGLSRRIGLSKSKGKYIAFIDSDDLWKKNKLLEQIKFMKNNKCLFSFTNVIYIKNNFKYFMNYHVPKIIDYSTLIKQNVIVTSSVIIDSKIKNKIQFIEDGYDDYNCWLSLLKKGYKALFLNKYLTVYKIRNKSVSSNKFKSFLWVWKILRKYQNLNLFVSILKIIIIIINTFKKKMSLQKL